MKIWNELDDTTQNSIKFLAIGVVLLVSALLFWSGNKYDEELNAPIVINKYPVKEVKLIDAYKKNGEYYMSILDMTTAKRYENVFLSSSCPNFKNLPGQKMYVAITHKIKPVTQENLFEFERAYDYICTNKNMEAADEKLEKELAKALKEGSVYKGAPVTLSPEEEADRKKRLNEAPSTPNN